MRYSADLNYRNESIIDNRLNGETKLVYQILYRAVMDCLASDVTVTIVDQKSAVSWILSDKKSAYSFRWCCELLDLDPNRLIKYLNDKGLIKKIRAKKIPYQPFRLWTKKIK